MKINYIHEDLFTTPCDVIAHGCNVQGVMGSGVAKLIKEKYFNAYQEYYNLYTQGKLTLGTVQIVKFSQKYIANCVTQRYYGKENKVYVDYEAFAECMKKLNYVGKSKNLTIAMPKIGSGLGGGNWDILEEIIEEEFQDVVPNVYIL